MWRDRDWLSTHVWLSVERSRDVPIMLSAQPKLKKSAFNMSSYMGVFGAHLNNQGHSCLEGSHWST